MQVRQLRETITRVYALELTDAPEISAPWKLDVPITPYMAYLELRTVVANKEAGASSTPGMLIRVRLANNTSSIRYEREDSEVPDLVWELIDMCGLTDCAAHWWSFRRGVN